MKKVFISILTLSLILLITGCNQKQSQAQNSSDAQNQVQSESQTQEGSNTPDAVVSNFLKDLQQQNYAGIKSFYTENMDNMANIRNQVEALSPTIANELFSKLADFKYSVDDYTVDPNDSSKATVFVTIDYYDIGNVFETTLLEYVKTDIEMTFDGKKDDDITKKADELIVQNIKASQMTTASRIPISLILDKDTWKLEKISENPELINALTGNILNTIEKLSSKLSTD